MRRWASELANWHEDVEYGNAWERIAIVPTVGWPLQSLEWSEAKFFHLSVFRFKGLRMSWIMDLWCIYALPGAIAVGPICGPQAAANELPPRATRHIPSWRYMAMHGISWYLLDIPPGCFRLPASRTVTPIRPLRRIARLKRPRMAEEDSINCGCFLGTYLICHLTITKYFKIRSNYQTYYHAVVPQIVPLAHGFSAIWRVQFHGCKLISVVFARFFGSGVCFLPFSHSEGYSTGYSYGRRAILAAILLCNSGPAAAAIWQGCRVSAFHFSATWYLIVELSERDQCTKYLNQVAPQLLGRGDWQS